MRSENLFVCDSFYNVIISMWFLISDFDLFASISNDIGREILMTSMSSSFYLFKQSGCVTMVGASHKPKKLNLSVRLLNQTFVSSLFVL